MEYQPLNATNEEIRLVTIIPTPPTAEKSIEQSDHHGSTLTDLVRCRLDHVSLKDSGSL